MPNDLCMRVYQWEYSGTDRCENIKDNGRFYGRVARLPAQDPAHRILFSRSDCLHHAAGSHASWLRQVEAYLRNIDITVLASAWAMARRRPI